MAQSKSEKEDIRTVTIPHRLYKQMQNEIHDKRNALSVIDGLIIIHRQGKRSAFETLKRIQYRIDKERIRDYR